LNINQARLMISLLICCLVQFH